MYRQWWGTLVAALTLTTVILLSLLFLTGTAGSGTPGAALAATSPQTPNVIGVSPSSSPNDVDTVMTVTGTGFTAVLSGTEVVTAPTVQLNDTRLSEVGYVSSTTLTATVPWGTNPGVYTVTVANPDGSSGSLANAFTVTQGLGIWTTGGPYGGEVRELVQNPVTSTTLYALMHDTGIFVSEDGGANWRPMVIDFWPTHLSVSPVRPEVMYFGGGASSMYRSMDGGSTWQRVLWVNLLGGQEIYPAAHPVSPTVVYAGVTAALNRLPGPGEQGGIYRSNDYGANWVTLTVGLTDTSVTALAFQPGDPNRMIAGTRSGNIFTSSDAGASWAWTARVGTHIERLTINPSGAHEVWAIASSPIASISPPYLYRSLDPGLTTWISATMTTNPGLPAWFEPVWSLTFHPTISGTIWAAAGRSLGGNGFVSTDGGQTWSAAGPSLPQAWSGTTAFVIDPVTPNVMYAGTVAFGTYKSTDGGTTWALSNEGLAGVSPEALAVSPANANEAYAATNSMGLLKTTNGGRSWQRLGIQRNGFPWRGSPLAVDPFVSTRVYLGSGCPGPCIKIGEAGGSSWRNITLTVPSALSGWSGDTFAIAPDPTLRGRILAGATFYPPNFDYSVPRRPLGGIYASDDYGEHWSQVSISQPISGVVEFAYGPADSQVVYAATEGTGLLKSTDGGSTWQSVSSWPGTPKIWSVVTDPNDRRIVYVHNPGDNIQNIYASPDAGATWTPVTWGEGQGGVWTLRFTPPPTSTLYLGTLGGGLYRASGGGGGWERVAGVPGTGSVFALATGRDGQRIVLYTGVSAGLASSGTQTAGSNGPARVVYASGGAMGAGVYRLTTLLQLNQRVYLPTVVKAYTP